MYHVHFVIMTRPFRQERLILFQYYEIWRDVVFLVTGWVGLCENFLIFFTLCEWNASR